MTFILLFISSHSKAWIYVSEKVKEKNRTLIRGDLTYLYQRTFDQANVPPSMLALLDIKELSGHSLYSWLHQRVNYVVEDNYFNLLKILSGSVYIINRNQLYPPNEIESELIYKTEDVSIVSPSLPTIPLRNEEEGFVVMQNLGAAVYLKGKEDHILYGMKISRGLFRLRIKSVLSSPRAGIIQIGDGLFSPRLSPEPNELSHPSNQIFRLQTFFHEARHSDGHGKSLAFSHQVCPQGHDYFPHPACDIPDNGPYTLGAKLTNELIKTCSECNEKQKEQLTLVMIDSFYRKLNKTQNPVLWDETPEYIIKESN